MKSIQDRACEVFKQISESKSIRGRGLAAVCAAVVYIACRCASHRKLELQVRQCAMPASYLHQSYSSAKLCGCMDLQAGEQPADL